MSAKPQLTRPQASPETQASSSAAQPVSLTSPAYAATELKITKPGSPTNQESPPDSRRPIAAKTQLTIPSVSTEERASSSAARPDSLELVSFGDWGSAPQTPPGLSGFGNVDAAPSLMLPSPETPLYNAFLDKLATTGDEDVMECLADFGIFDKLKF